MSDMTTPDPQQPPTDEQVEALISSMMSLVDLGCREGYEDEAKETEQAAATLRSLLAENRRKDGLLRVASDALGREIEQIDREIAAVDAALTPPDAEPEGKKAPPEPERLTAEQSLEIANSGEWVRHGGYTWRNFTEADGTMTGQYQAFGEYPQCIRGTGKPWTLDSFKSKPWWIRWTPPAPTATQPEENRDEC